MATPQEVIDIAVLQNDQRQVRKDISEIKSDIKSILDRVDIEKLDARYPTRREVAVLRWAVGFLIAATASLGTMLMALWGHLK